MIEIIKELSIEVTKPNIFQALVAKQYDMNTRFLKVTLMDCGKRIDVPLTGTSKVIINAERKDGQSKGFDGVINEDGTVTVPLHSWMLELDGSVICDISVVDTATDDNKRLTTTSFTLLVEKAAYGGDDVTTDPQYDVLVSLLETCSEASAVAQEALEKSNEANAKYEACVEATEAANEAANNANAVREEVEAGGYIESLKELNNGNMFRFWVGTQEEYDALESKYPHCLYIKTDDDMADYVIEEGIWDNLDNNNKKINWNYRKWKSGVAECWCSFDADITSIAKANENYFYTLIPGQIGEYNGVEGPIRGYEFPNDKSNVKLFTEVPLLNLSVGNEKCGALNFGNALLEPLCSIPRSYDTGYLYVKCHSFNVGSANVTESTRGDGIVEYTFNNGISIPVYVGIEAKGRWK